ncbi:MAG: glucose-6-phosphate isomerase, partial [Bacteroidota bacterium]|nr:glucose-6-phosphate isomerase [Bacteroidota bacterium]
MTLPKINPTTTKSWKLLENSNKEENIKALFQNNVNRAKNFSISFEDFHLDYSKNMISKNVMGLLLNLAEECHLKKAIQSQFDGLEINETENRKVLHTAVRSFQKTTPNYDQIIKDRKKLKDFTEKVLRGELKGSTGKTFTDIVNIGIGGSDLGPVMVVEALKFYKTSLNFHFV